MSASPPTASVLRHLRIPCAQKTDALVCATASHRFALAIGFPVRPAREVAICVSELVSNVIRHAQAPGELELLELNDVTRCGVRVCVSDQGLGFPVAAAFEDGWSRGRLRAPGEPTELCLGLGLGAVRRLMEVVSVESRPGSTRIVTEKWVPLGRS